MPRIGREVDLLNAPIRLAAEMAFQQIQYAKRLAPNPIGQVTGREMPSRIRLEDIRRLAKGG